MPLSTSPTTDRVMIVLELKQGVYYRYRCRTAVNVGGRGLSLASGSGGGGLP